MEEKIATSSNKKHKKKNENDKETTKESIKYALFSENSSYINVIKLLGGGEWGSGGGRLGLGVGPKSQFPIPHSPIPNDFLFKLIYRSIF